MASVAQENDLNPIEGNTARALTGTSRERFPAPGAGRDDRMKDWAARFLADELPESLRPTQDRKRLQVALVWGRDQLIDVQDVAVGATLTAGHAQQATLQISHASLAGATPLVQCTQTGARILLPKGTNAHVRTGGRELTVEELVSAGQAQAVEVPVYGAGYDLGLDDRVRLEFGQLQVIARFTRPQAFKKRAFGERIDVNFISTIIILLLLGVAFERMIAITDFSPVGGDDDLFKSRDIFVKNSAVAAEQPKPLEKLAAMDPGAKAAEKEGIVGVPKREPAKAAPAKAGAPMVDKNKRDEDRRKVDQAGLVGLLGDSAATASLLGSGGIGTVLNDAIGGIDNKAPLGDADGTFGLGLRGNGPGGGDRFLGIGFIGDRGKGRGCCGTEYGIGAHTGHPPTTIVPGATHVVGGLSADEVGRIVRRHWNEIKYCYETELSRDPNLAGKVGVSFQIGPVGDVLSTDVRESDLKNANVESCMLKNIRRWKFPEPRGGGVVEVNYPFIFQSGR